MSPEVRGSFLDTKVAEGNWQYDAFLEKIEHDEESRNFAVMATFDQWKAT